MSGDEVEELIDAWWRASAVGRLSTLSDAVEEGRAGDVPLTAEELRHIAYVLLAKSDFVNNEPLRLSGDGPDAVICIDCRMHGTWADIPHSDTCPYMVARRLCGYAGARGFNLDVELADDHDEENVG